MFYRVKNLLIENKITKLNAAANRFLLRDLSEQKGLLEIIETKEKNDIASDFLDKDVIQDSINNIERRLKVINRYAVLIDTFKKDPVRRYMVNHNFFQYLHAIQLLHNNSSYTIEDLEQIGVFYAIDKVEKAFSELTN